MGDDTKSKVMKELFKKFRQNSNSNTITGLSEKAEGILSKAVELWPILQRPFARDPVEDALKLMGFVEKKSVIYICHIKKKIHSVFNIHPVKYKSYKLIYSNKD